VARKTDILADLLSDTVKNLINTLGSPAVPKRRAKDREK